jgi:peptide-methionine (S)-S-oxide reductase
MKKIRFTFIVASVILLESFNGITEIYKNSNIMNDGLEYEVATFGSGCFWCTEAVFERLDGVIRVVSGYAGGHIKNPSYKEVTSGQTGHAEVCQVFFDPKVITYKELLDVFWHTHDPTTWNRQGNDHGPQYRSVIFYHNAGQQKFAEDSKKQMAISGNFNDPIVTEIREFTDFYEAEDYHQDYFKNNPNQPYCTFIVKPKVEKFNLKYQDKLKQGYIQ